MTPQVDMRLPPDRFYWAVISDPGPGRRAGRRSAARLGCLFEEVLPVPIESVCAVYTPLPGGRWLACGMEHDALSAAAAAALRLGPSALPAFADVPVSPGSINLLVGERTPAPLRRVRRRAALSAAAAGAACLAFITAGIERRIAAAEARAAGAADAQGSLYAGALPPAARGAQTPAIRLASELRLLRRTRAEADAPRVLDAAPALAAVLAAWPKDLNTRTESITALGSAVMCTVSVDSHEDAQRLSGALGGAPGWRMEQPQVTSSARGVRVVLRLIPERGGRP